jgi:hypothetical protein
LPTGVTEATTANGQHTGESKTSGSLMKTRKYPLPDFLTSTLSQTQYERWLQRKAVAHVRRDRKRGNKSATNEEYKVAIHQAVIASHGRDFYTGEAMDWALVSTYDNKLSGANGRVYKAQFALLPTVDHVDDGLGPADFKICTWRTNDAKSDLPLDEFIALCNRVVRHLGHSECDRRLEIRALVACSGRGETHHTARLPTRTRLKAPGVNCRAG